MAEGVETAEQLAFLAKESCDEVQGYLIGKPRPIEEYAEVTGRRPERQLKFCPPFSETGADSPSTLRVAG
jgi:sensor c-di-GMP phosphodiesterase-like protein